MTATMKVTNLQNESSLTPNIVLNADGTTTIPTQSTTNLAYTGTLTGGTGIINIGSGQVYKDASGNVGIGTSSLAYKLQVQSVGTGTTAASNIVGRFQTNGSGYDVFVQFSDNVANAGGIGMVGGAMYLANGTTRNLTLDSSGNLLVNTISQRSAGKICFDINGSVNAGIVAYPLTNSGIDAFRFLNNAGSQVGVIQCTPTATFYVTSSDYRLKENVTPMQNALATVAQLKPCTYTWKADGSAGQGFIAHELQEVVPDCVTGEKDAVDADGNPKYQGVDTSFLVATLVSAIQEQQAIITQLQADVAALKGAE